MVIFWMTQGDVAFKRALEYTELPEEVSIQLFYMWLTANKHLSVLYACEIQSKIIGDQSINLFCNISEM